MKFKILKGTDTFKKLKDLESKMEECNGAASDLCKELGGSVDGTWLGKGYRCIAGGVSGIRLEAKPDGWKLADRDHEGYYIPKINKINKPLLDRIDALPTLNYDDLNGIVGFHHQTSGLRWFNCPGVNWFDEYVLLSVDNACKFIPNHDMVEILESEYISLKSIS